MPKAIFVNLACQDLRRSKAFFEALGFSFNPQFTNDDAACLVISDRIYAMLHTPASFRRFTSKDIADAHKTSEALLALQVESKETVDAFLEKALAAGGRQSREPQDHGFMYERAFEDLDGHIWEIFWMDVQAAPH
jgi:predicted lactoylglutathione lyase